MPQLMTHRSFLTTACFLLLLYIFCNLTGLPAYSQSPSLDSHSISSPSPQTQAGAPSATSEQAVSLQAFMPRVSPATLRYSHIKYAVYFLQSGFEILAAYLFLQFGLAKALQAKAESSTSKLLGQLLIFIPVFYVFIFLATLPLRFYSSFWLEHAMNLSDQPFWGWFEDRLKFLALNIATELLLWLLLFFSLKRLPKAWPYVVFGVSLPLIVLAVFAAPVVFDPVFNDFTLMPKSPLRDRITALAAKAGLPDASIYVSNHSKQSKKINAYVTGIGASARIVLFDTTVQKLPEDEVLAIVAHELGHNVLSHINCGCVITALFSLCMLPFNIYCTPLLVRRLPRAWQIRDLTDIALIPVVVLASCIVSFLGDPIINSYSRRIEHEADAYGLELTGNGQAMARLFVALSEQNLSEPDPSKFIEFWYFSHPSLKDRIQFALSKH